ncbi:hypothetical protein DYB25_003154 [Aphanomyces astaci]|uniref:Uncharacterized protein n=1 Tax=Aphanomyces astaci TaxID=112090 RepID=A0A397EVW8_APHAT|nr:hypothetical protein DYB25_003154 [Aphanomyces astaci]RHY40659.1 hypothetical protein DYB30_001381 [Aphanomyces astaci]RHY52748.1 hypothetical protein DYB34_004327 [Aphanomyces astaci]RHY75097.1 hypothetical protein DYB38_000318 [Aphanomyces astaci]RHZ01775.1 hypothetical protein DYB31_000655 [Aphanomyces astaci]
MTAANMNSLEFDTLSADLAGALPDVFGTYGIYGLYAGVGVLVWLVSYLVVISLEIRPLAAHEGLVSSQPDTVSRIMSISSLFFALLCVLTPPVDVYVATTHHLNQAKAIGTFYNVLFVVLLLYSFLLSPFAYFYAKQSEIHHITRYSTSQRVASALKRTACFLCFMLILILVVLVIVVGGKPKTSDIDWLKPLLDLQTDATLTLHVFLGLVLSMGMILWIWLGCRAMATVPVDGFLRPRHNDRAALSYLMEEIELEAHSIERARQAVLRKFTVTGVMSDVDQARLDELKSRDQVLLERRRVFAKQSKKWLCCTSLVWRLPIGIVLMLVSILIVVSLLLTPLLQIRTNTIPTGFVIDHPSLPNPIDIVLVLASQIFPLDYAIFATCFLYIFVVSFVWLGRRGFQFLCFRIDRLHRHHTSPSTLVLTTLSMVYLALVGLFSLPTLAPQYTAFGHQQFTINGTTLPCSFNATTADTTCKASQLAQIYNGFAVSVPLAGTAFVVAQVLCALVFVPFVIQAYLLTDDRPTDGPADDPKREALLKR